jgi:lipoprotein-releasing system permease protein
MTYEFFLAARYLTGLRRSQPVVSVIAFISVLGIALGVASLMVVIGVMSGFDADLEEKIIGANPHLLIQVEGGIREPEAAIEKIMEVPGVVAASPVLQTQVLVKRGDESVGALLRGIDPVREPQVTRLAELLKKGNWGVRPGDLLIGSEMAGRWGLRVGDSIAVVGGEKAKPFPAKVGGIFTTGMYEYDMYLTLASIETVQQVLNQSGVVSGIGVRIDQAIHAPELQKTLRKQLGYPYWITSWMDMNSNLFAALKLEKMTMFIILTLIVLVACFNIIATLLMLVVGKTKEIGILKSIGASQASVRRVFTLAGLMIGTAGIALGMLAGTAICLALKKYQFVKLPADIYYIDHLPVLLKWNDIASVLLAALVITWAACVYPAWVAARMQPAKALRYE